MKFNIITFGCKVNQYESNMMKEKMLHHNFSYVLNESDADIIIVNTCTVTNTADNKCLKMIRHLKRNYPHTLIVVCGCSSQNNPDAYKNLGIDIIMGTKDKSKIAETIKEYLKTKKPIMTLLEKRVMPFEDMVLNNYNHVRAFIKIEDGCDNFCSYCIIPFVRGSVRSKDYQTILSEVQNEVNNKHQEIVLTGIHTGRYENNGHDLSDLIHDLALIPELKRIRISSIEVTELNDKFMAELKNNPKLCSHLHIPLQSGSDAILKSMNRKYDVAYFKEKIQKIRSIRPDIAISTDIIVGFPGETKENFFETYSLAEELKFSKIHVFPYSRRKKTKADTLPNQIPENIKKERSHMLIELSNKLELKYADQFKNKKSDILIEKSEDGMSEGHTSNYLKVILQEELEVGKIYERCL